MRVLKVYTSLRFALASALMAGLWALEKRTHEQAATAAVELREKIDALTVENARLVKIDQLKSNFIADAAHELRSPIANLNVRLYLLEHASSDRRADYLADLKYQLDRLNRLSENLLTISRLDAVDLSRHFTSVNLNHVVEEVVVAYRPVAESVGLQLQSTYAAHLPAVHGDYGQLVQVGTNLVTNAIRYTTAGQITVETRLDAVKKRVCLQVKDTGMGIMPDDLPHLFERFYRGSYGGRKSGTGLGLNIVKEIVDMHGGNIEVESQVGSGSLFKVCLPLAPGPVNDCE